MAFSAYLPASIVLPCSFYTSSWFTHPTSSPIPGGTADGKNWGFSIKGLECRVLGSGFRLSGFGVSSWVKGLLRGQNSDIRGSGAWGC